MQLPNKIELQDQADFLENIEYIADTVNMLIKYLEAQNEELSK